MKNLFLIQSMEIVMGEVLILRMIHMFYVERILID